MQNITSVAGLKKAIQLLEAEQSDNRHLLKGQFYIIYERFTPVNLLQRTLNDISSTPNLADSIAGALLGLATGFFSGGIFSGTTGPRLGKLIGPVLQAGVTNLAGQNFKNIRSFGEIMLLRIFRKRKMKAGNRDK